MCGNIANAWITLDVFNYENIKNMKQSLLENRRTSVTVVDMFRDFFVQLILVNIFGLLILAGWIEFSSKMVPLTDFFRHT